MNFVIILISLPLYLLATPIYDFWENSTKTNNKNKIEVRDVDLSNQKFLSDSIRPNIAKDFDENNINLADDLGDMPIKDRYLRYNIKGEKDPQIAKDLDPTKIKVAPDYAEDQISKRKIQKANTQKKDSKKNIRTPAKTIEVNNQLNYRDESLSFNDDYITFYDEKDREQSFIEAIPYITLGNSLFVITQDEYSARVLDDSISASIAFDLGLNYIWDHLNIGYLWNLNLGTYDFNEKDRTNPNAQSKGEISGNTFSAMPTIFYELNRAQRMSVLIGYGLGVSYIRLAGSATLANSNNETIKNNIEIKDFYLSHGLLIEILHNNLMFAFTKVNIKIEEEGQNIEINENRLNIGYKFSF